MPEASDPLVGSMLGKDYRVLAPIGVGGMAVVYLVEHQTLLKQFAAKVLSPALASSLEARARFTQEAHAASQLDHENIVSITDFGVTGDQRPFFIMELLRGQPLDQRLAEGRMSIQEVVAVCVPVARALAHAHAEGIVHLDVKPENIFLVQRSQGRWGVKVVDFGIAKTPLSPTMTKLGETAGSPLFMAPEVCRGDDDIDQRADVYSFGILLYLMMCGRLPFEDDSVHRILQMQLVQLPAPPRELNAELTPEVAAIVERALAKRREDRYGSMDALMHDFAAALPAGADRLLIEAQSGAALGETPFAGALSGLDSLRAARATYPPGAIPPSGAPGPGASSSMAVLPTARTSYRLPIVLATAIVATFAGVLILHRLSNPPGGARVRVAQARPATHGDPSTASAPAARPTVQPIEPAAPAPAAPAVAPAAPTEPTADPAAAPAVEPDPPEEPAGAAASPAPRAADPAKRPAVRPRPLVRRDPVRPAAKRVAAVAPGPSAPPPAATPALVATAPVEQPAPAPPASPPAVEPRPTPPAASPLPPPVPPVAVTPAAPPSPGALDATPSVVSLDVKGSLSPSIVRRGVERQLTALRACYRTAAREGNATPAVELKLTFEVDENSLATHVAAGGSRFGSLASCAIGVAGQIRTQEAPDVGTAQVTVVIGFRPS